MAAGGCSTSSITSRRSRSSSSPASSSGTTEPTNSAPEAALPACQNLLLAARALGYGGVYDDVARLRREAVAVDAGDPDDFAIASTIAARGAAGCTRSGAPPGRRRVVYDDGWKQHADWATDSAGDALRGAVLVGVLVRRSVGLQAGSPGPCARGDGSPAAPRARWLTTRACRSRRS